MAARGRRKRNLAILLVAVIMLGCVGFRTYRHLVPWGMDHNSWEAFNRAGIDQGWRVSPGGSRRVRVVVNDAGGMHSGRFYVWILAPNLLWGDRVVAAGYVDDSRAPVTVRWLDETSFEVKFYRRKRDSHEQVTHVISLD